MNPPETAQDNQRTADEGARCGTAANNARSTVIPKSGAEYPSADALTAGKI